MPGFYFPKKQNLTLISSDQKQAIREALDLVKEDLPWSYINSSKIDYYKDVGMKNTGVLGHTTFFHPNRVLLSPLIVEGLAYKDQHGIPNNENVMNTVFHELTHLDQMRWFKGVIWSILNNPLFAYFTLEKWANENGSRASVILENNYSLLRKGVV